MKTPLIDFLILGIPKEKKISMLFNMLRTGNYFAARILIDVCAGREEGLTLDEIINIKNKACNR